jgi:folate-dependent phosphoribosylglycinamide formyltransferase PurN
VKQLIYDPTKSGKRMTIVCFVSGSGTNYREIVKRDPNHHYVVFTNRIDCGGVAVARQFGHEVITLSHIPYLREARKKYGAGNIPRNAPERIKYEQDLSRLVEDKIGNLPDLICLAGFDQWNTDWMIDRYYPRMLNVHPGDTTKGYAGLHWIPAAKAVLAGDETLRSTLFIVDKSEDRGPVLVQSEPLKIVNTLEELEGQGMKGLLEGLRKVMYFAHGHSITRYEEFVQSAGKEVMDTMESICISLQNALKVRGDWMIYPFAVHDLIAKGRAAIDNGTVYIDGNRMPGYGYRLG